MIETKREQSNVTIYLMFGVSFKDGVNIILKTLVAVTAVSQTEFLYQCSYTVKKFKER